MDRTILNLGAGRQSTCLYLLACEGKIGPLDCAIFADTQEEEEATYRHLQWLQSLGGPPILIRTIGKMGEHLAAGTVGAGGRKKKRLGPDGSARFASIPAFTAPHHELRHGAKAKEGRVRRQCTKEYKVEVIERTIRREILGLKARQRVPKGTTVVQWFGISADEKDRCCGIRQRFEKIRWAEPRFPLIELGWRLGDCLDYLREKVPHPVVKSACAFCPYRSNQEFLALKMRDPAAFARAVEIDRALRPEGTVANQGLSHSLYVHRKCIPLEMVDLEAEAAKERQRKGPDLFRAYCDDGMCGL